MDAFDRRLKDAWTVEVPARDPAFALALAQKLARRRLFADLAVSGLLAAAAGLALWAVWPRVAFAAGAAAERAWEVGAPAALALAVVLSVLAFDQVQTRSA